jgi:hypothetical protein
MAHLEGAMALLNTVNITKKYQEFCDNRKRTRTAVHRASNVIYLRANLAETWHPWQVLSCEVAFAGVARRQYATSQLLRMLIKRSVTERMGTV